MIWKKQVNLYKNLMKYGKKEWLMNEFKLEISGYDREIIESAIKKVEGLLKEGIDNITAKDIERGICGGFGGGVNREDTFEGSGGGSAENINFYPSKIKGPCCKIAVFVSLKKGRGLALYNAWQKLINHMQGRCLQTELAIFFTDSWEYDKYEEWKANIKTIRSNGRRVYFILITQAECILLNV
jgi:hypothetical protein